MKTGRKVLLGFLIRLTGVPENSKQREQAEQSTGATVASSIGPVSDSTTFCGRGQMLTSRDKESESTWEWKGALDPRV